MKRTKPDFNKEKKQNRTARSVFLCLLYASVFWLLPNTGMGKTIPESDSELHQYDSIPMQPLTRFGFTNLFTQQQYRPEIPYHEQVNPHTERFMRDYLQVHRKHLENLKKTSGNYFSFIESMLKTYGLPIELKYLAVIESNLKREATSWVGAAGPWQFMPETARRFGLVVSRERDDRRDFVASTQAASRYLTELFETFQDWLLVIAAYNGGPGLVQKAIAKSGSRHFWTLQHYLPKESRDHVKKFIATHYIMETEPVMSLHKPNHLNPGLHDVNTRLEMQSLKGSYRGSIIAEALGMDASTFERYNPAFDRQLAINGCYPLRLPAEQMEVFNQKKQAILERSVRQWMNQH